MLMEKRPVKSKDAADGKVVWKESCLCCDSSVGWKHLL